MMEMKIWPESNMAGAYIPKLMDMNLMQAYTTIRFLALTRGCIQNLNGVTIPSSIPNGGHVCYAESEESETCFCSSSGCNRKGFIDQGGDFDFDTGKASLGRLFNTCNRWETKILWQLLVLFRSVVLIAVKKDTFTERYTIMVALLSLTCKCDCFHSGASTCLCGTSCPAGNKDRQFSCQKDPHYRNCQCGATCGGCD